MAAHEDEFPDLTEHLAELVGLTAEEFVERYGSGWWPAPGPGLTGAGWHVASDPPQLMLRVDGAVEVGRPVGSWRGVAHLVFEAVDVVVMSGRAGADRRAVDRLLARRRAELRHCAACRSLTGPEYLLDDVCMGCASRWRGVVF